MYAINSSCMYLWRAANKSKHSMISLARSIFDFPDHLPAPIITSHNKPFLWSEISFSLPGAKCKLTWRHDVSWTPKRISHKQTHQFMICWLCLWCHSNSKSTMSDSKCCRTFHPPPDYFPTSMLLRTLGSWSQSYRLKAFVCGLSHR